MEQFENSKAYFKFEYIHDGYRTVVEKEFDTNGQFEYILDEIVNALLACGYARATIDKYIGQ